MATKAVAYLRVSGRGQVDGHGFDRQRDTIAAWAKRHGVRLVNEYREDVSGTKEETDRPVFQTMLADLLANGCRTIVVESLDRFARDLGVQLQLLAYLKAKGVRLVSAITGDDVTAAMDDDPMRRAMVQVQGTFAELEKNLLVRKLRKAREQQRVEQGRCEGRKPYGTRPGEADGLALIRQLRGKGRKAKASFAAIARELNTRHIATRTGRPWQPSTVGGIVARF
jgi:DNA invertase Pin-like site-specific DNA recombinase